MEDPVPMLQEEIVHNSKIIQPERTKHLENSQQYPAKVNIGKDRRKHKTLNKKQKTEEDALLQQACEQAEHEKHKHRQLCASAMRILTEVVNKKQPKCPRCSQVLVPDAEPDLAAQGVCCFMCMRTVSDLQAVATCRKCCFAECARCICAKRERELE